MKNLEIIRAINGLDKMLKEDRVFPVRVSYALSKNIKELIGAYEIYEPEREKIMKGIEKKTEEEQKKARQDLYELLEIDNKDIAIHKISLEDIEKCGELTLGEVQAFEFMLEESGE